MVKKINNIMSGIQLWEGTFFISVFILVVTETIGMRYFYQMSKKDHCPRCRSKDIIEYDDFIECPKCDLEFDKEFLGVIPDEDILARQELIGIANSLMDLERQKKDY
jgi:hypothetical protein